MAAEPCIVLRVSAGWRVWSGISDTPVTFCNRVCYTNNCQREAQGKPGKSRKAPKMNIYQISSYIYNNTGSDIDTEVVNGICPDDTIEVSKRDSRQFLAIGFDPTDDSFILGILWYRHENGDKEAVEGGLCWHIDGEEDYDTLDDICEYARKEL